MLKIRDQMIRAQDEQLIHMSKFFDYLYDSVIRVQLDDKLDELERENSLPKAKNFLPNKIIKVANNKNYQPLIGA